jgi:hypothetical protein
MAGEAARKKASSDGTLKRPKKAYSFYQKMKI